MDGYKTRLSICRPLLTSCSPFKVKLCYCPLRVDRFVFASSCIDIRKNSDDDDDDGYHICSACLIGFHPLVRFGFFKWAIPASFRLFSSFQTNITNFTTNVCEKNVHLPSIRCWDSNPRPPEHESPSITTRPGLPPSRLLRFDENFESQKWR